MSSKTKSQLETELKAAQANARRWQLLVEQGSDAIALVAADGTILYESPAVENMLGYAPEELQGKNAFDLLHPADQENATQGFAQLLTQSIKSGINQMRLIRKDGSICWVEASITNRLNDPGLGAVVIDYRDVTERKQAESQREAAFEKLRESEANLSEAQRAAKLGSWSFDVATNAVKWSEELYRIFEVEKAEFGEMYESFLSHVHPEDRQLLLGVNRKTRETGEPFQVEYRIETRSGALKYIREEGYATKNAEGMVTGLFGIAQDISERKQVEQKLRESEERLGLVMEGSQLGYWDWDIETGKVYRNERWAEMLGYTLAEIELNVKQWTDLYHPDDREAAWKSIQDHLDGKTPAHRIEYRMRAKDGEYKWILDQARVVKRDAQGKPLRMSGTHTDIAERKQVEERIERQNRRLHALREIDTAILAADSAENIVGAALSNIRQLIECPRATVNLVDVDTQEIIVFQVNTDGEIVPPTGTRIPLAAYRWMEQSFENNQPVVLNDLTALPSLPPELQRAVQAGLRSMCVLPLFAHANLIGTFSLSSAGVDFFDEEKINLAREVANQIAIAITQNKLINNLRESEEYLRLAYEAAGLGIWKNDLRSGAVEFDERARIHYGFETNNTTIDEVIKRVHPDDVAKLGSEIAAATAPTGSGMFATEYRVIYPNGSVHWLDIRVRVLFEGEGLERHSILGYGTTMDITARKQAEQKLRENAQQLLALVTSLDDIVFEVDEGGTYLNVWTANERALFQPIEKIIGRRFDEIFGAEASRPYFEYLERCLQTAETQDLEYAVELPDGTRWFNARYNPIFHGGTRKTASILVRDITERKQAEKELKRWKDIFDNVNWGIVIGGPQGKTLDMMNPAFAAMHGYTEQELTGAPIVDVFAPECRAEVTEQIRRAHETGHNTFESKHIRKDGTIFPVAIDIAAIKDETGKVLYRIVGVQDITERKRAEEALQTNERLLRLFVEYSPAAIAMFDCEMKYIVASQRYLTDFHLGEKKLTGRSHYEVFPEMDEARKEIHRRCLAGEVAKSEEDPLPRLDGTLDWVRYELRPWYEASGEIGGLIFFSEVITERKQTEEALKESETKFRALFENLPMQGSLYKLIRNEQGRIIDWEVSDINPLGAASLGSPASDLIGRRASTLFGDEVMAPYLETCRQIAASGKPQMFETHFEANGKDYLSSAFLVGSEQYATISVDITERKQAEQKLRASEERFRSLFESSHAIMLIIEPVSGVIMDSNPAAAEFYGYPGLTGMNINDINQLSPDEVAAERLKAINAQQNYFVFPHRLASGEIRTVEVRSSRIELNDQALLFSIISDITERQRTEDKLRENEETLRTVFENSPVAIEIYDKNGVVQKCNKKVDEMFGMDANAQIGKFNLRDDPNYQYPNVWEKLQRGEEVQHEVYFDFAQVPYPTSKQGEAYYHIITTPIPESVSGSIGYIMQIVDITERKRAEDNLRASEEKFRLLAETIGEVFWMFDNQQQKMDYISPAYEKIWGHTTKSLYEDNQQYVDAILPEDRHIIFEALEKQARGEETEMEYRIAHRDGSIRWIYDRSFPIFDARGSVARTTGIAADITERKRNEALIYAQRDLARAVGSYHTLLEGFPAFLQTIIAVSGMDSGGIYLFDEERQNMALVCHWGLGQAFTETVSHFTSDAPQVKIILAGKPLYFSSEHPVVQNAMHQAEGLQSLASVPILYQERVIGCMNLASHTLAEMPDFARHVFETLAVEIGNFVVYLRNEEALRASEEKYRTLSQELEQRVQQRTAEVQDLYDNAPTGYHSLDAEGRYARINQTELSWLGYTREEMLGRSFADFVTAHSAHLFQETFPTLKRAGRVSNIEFDIQRKDGSTFPILLNAIAVYDEQGNYLHSRSTMFDNTERKKAEEALRESHDRLSIANIELEKAMRVKDEFLASMSHELRTPLTGILGLSEALQLNTYGELTGKQQKALKSIRESGNHLLALINDILDLSKIESGKLEIQTASCSLADICQASLQLTKGMAHQKRQVVDYSAPAEPIILNVDMRRIKQVIVNLLGNAIKFTPENGGLGLSIEPDAAQRQVRIIVWDKGIGIKPEHLPKLFRPFTQIDSSLAREYSGTGLGLSLVKRLVELHDGTVAVESIFGAGSRFIVTLPWTPQAKYTSVQMPDELELTPESAAENSLAQLILITDDNQLLIEMLSDFLEAQNYRTAKVYNGREFLEKVAQIRPDLILMDIQMPGMDGLEVIHRLRQHPEPAIAAIPVIAVTALAMTGDRELCLAAGANEYISKPVNLGELKQMIHDLIGNDPE